MEANNLIIPKSLSRNKNLSVVEDQFSGIGWYALKNGVWVYFFY